MILAIHAICWDGMIGSVPARYFKKAFWCFVYIFFTGHLMHVPARLLADRWTSKAFKPVFDCLICMGSIWSLVLGAMLFHLNTVQTVPIMLIVCGINVVLDSLIYYLRGYGREL